MIDIKQIEKHIEDLNADAVKYIEEMNFTKVAPETHEYKIAKKYIKIIKTSCGQKSVHSFIDKENGNIFKPAGWSKPAKGIRGNILSENKPLRSGQLYRC